MFYFINNFGNDPQGLTCRNFHQLNQIQRLFGCFTGRRGPRLRHEANRRFFFDFSEVSTVESVTGAELRLFKYPGRRKWMYPRRFTVNVYVMKRGADPESVGFVFIRYYSPGPTCTKHLNLRSSLYVNFLYDL